MPSAFRPLLFALTALSLFAIDPVPLYAQAPFNACLDRFGTPIPSKTDNKMSWGGMAGYEDGKATIWWSKKNMNGLPEIDQLFVYLHECAHHTLDHPYGQNSYATENEADCWAMQLLVDGGMASQASIDSLLVSRSRVVGDGEHLGGEEHVRQLNTCVSIRTSRAAWAEALPPLVEAARWHFTRIRERLLESAAGRDSIWASTLDTPGTYDCEVMGSRRVRCLVFLSRDQKSAAGRYKKLTGTLTDWLPEGWSHVENQSPSPPFAKAFHAQDTTTGTTLSLLLGTDSKVYFVATAPSN